MAVGVDVLLVAKLLASRDGRRDPVGVGVRADVIEGRGDIVDMVIEMCSLRLLLRARSWSILR